MENFPGTEKFEEIFNNQYFEDKVAYFGARKSEKETWS